MNEITLTKELADEVVATLCKHQKMCEDRLVASQYLIAVAGYIVASHTPAGMDSRELVSELSAFLHHVHDDLKSAKPQASSHAPDSPSSPEDAFGIWKPPK